jgi:hypothetical protein
MKNTKFVLATMVFIGGFNYLSYRDRKSRDETESRLTEYYKKIWE